MSANEILDQLLSVIQNFLATDFSISVGGSLFASAIILFVGYLFGGNEYKQKINAASLVYAKNLDKLIKMAVKEGPYRAIVNARAIVSTRNDLRSSLEVILKNLNDEIDILEAQIVEREKSPRNVVEKDIFETIEVLSKKWPSKKAQIENGIRKVLAEMGLDKV